jgi:hypothetical protein
MRVTLKRLQLRVWLRGLATNTICSFGVPQREASVAVTRE